MSFYLPSQTYITVYGPPAKVMFQPLNIGLSNFEVDPAGNCVTCNSHLQWLSRPRPPAPAALPSLLSVVQMTFTCVQME